MLHELGLASAELPVVVLRFGAERPALVNPSNLKIADAFGVMRPISPGESSMWRWSARLGRARRRGHASSEGLRTVVIEHEAIGGQAGTSSMIRNYPGFSQGVSGAKLAQETWRQAWTFGTTFLYMRQAGGLSGTDGHCRLRLSDGDVLTTRTVVIATGAAYRRLGIPRLEDLRGRGVFYGAAASEAPAMRGRDVFVAGGGNSAGQTALHMAKWASGVTVLVRAGSLADSMSDYLIRQIDATPNVDVCYRVQWPAAPAPAISNRWNWPTPPPGRGAASRLTPCSSYRLPAPDRMARRQRRTRPVGVHPHRPGPAGRHRRPLAPRPPAAAAGDQPARRVRGR